MVSNQYYYNLCTDTSVNSNNVKSCIECGSLKQFELKRRTFLNFKI